VAEMVLAESQPVGPIEIRLGFLQIVGQKRFLEQLLAQPDRHAIRNDVNPRGL
jgi:hypothetical protein